MSNYRRTTSCWLICQALCFLLLLQGSGIAQALPLPPKQTFVSLAELEAPLDGAADPVPRAGDGALDRFLDAAGRAAAETGSTLMRWFEDPWPEAAPVRVAQAGGVLPLPPRLMSAFLGSSIQGQDGPPSPLSMAAELTGKPAKFEGTRFAIGQKAATEEIPLLAGYNLISIPEEPADSNPAAVFAAIAPQLERVEAYDACDLADPWKLYDPADAAASDLTVADHRIGMWVKADAPAVLPSDGTLPATTSIDLCAGWNLIGFPAGEPRHPAAALAPIAGKWLRVFAYDAFDSQDPWEIYDPNVPDWANDLQVMHPGRGYWVLATEAVTLEIRNQGPPPEVAITAPTDLAVVTEPTEITGTVDSDRLDRWTLTSLPVGDGEPVVLATGNAPIDGPLATLDPTLLLNGLYELKLTATDVQGQQVSDRIAVSIEGLMKIGHFTLSYLDLAVPVSGLDIEIIRAYDSRDKQPRDFGVGWSLSIRQGSYRTNRATGDGWQIVDSLPPTPFPCAGAVETKSHLAVVRLSDREVYRFQPQVVNTIPSAGRCDGRVVFEYVDGPLPGTTLEILGNDQVFYVNASGNDQLIDFDTLDVFEPENVRLTTRDGRVFDLNLTGGVTGIEDTHGNRLTLAADGILHSSGQSIDFTRDAEGRIIAITDPLGRTMTYSQDSGGDLIAVTDREGHTTTMTYNDRHDLLEVVDPLGNRAIRNDYDASGRLIATTDAAGRTISFDHDLAARREVITDRLGFIQVMEYNARGNVVRATDKLGEVTQRTFDGEDNLLSETDPLGRTTTFTYNAANDLTSRTDPLGKTTTFTHDGAGRMLTTTDPRGKVTTHVYDANGNLTSTTDAADHVTSFTYDGAGNRLTETDALGNVTSLEYNGTGDLIRTIDALGNEATYTYNAAGEHLSESRTRTLPAGGTETLTTSFTYDDMGRLTTTQAADGTTTSRGYDALGRIASETDELGRVTRLSYDARGRWTGTSFPDGTDESRSYDDAGRLLTRTDRAGRTTSHTYDAMGRMLTTTAPDGAVTHRAYNAAGELISTTDARGNVTTYTYDAAGRRVTVTDPLGNSNGTTYDDAGNKASTTDARGNTTTFIYDDLNRLTVTQLPDGSTTQTAYDALGREISETDQDGKVTQFGYDPLRRLTSVTDALGQVTSYTYDEVGNRLTQTDANGNTTSFAHDALGRRISRTFAGGATEAWTYNPDGTVATRTDPGGATTTYELDVNGRTTRRLYPDGSDVTFTYTPTGRRASYTESRGTTTYTWDARDRVTSITMPDGRSLDYTYDPAGNRASMTALVGASSFTTTYSHDPLNRLVTVTDSQGNVTTRAYDPDGNPQSVTYANGVTTAYTFDAQDRLTDLTTRDGLGAVLQSYAFTLSATGQRTRSDESDGTRRIYTYDDLHRLTEERVEDAGSSLVYSQGFTYDAVGNRLGLADDQGAGPVDTSYTYDPRDRLLTRGTESYGWDPNGNLTSRSGTGGATYSWDYENRLTGVTLDDGTQVNHLYDPDGVRVRTEIVPAGGGAPIATDYLNDTSGPLSHAVVESTAGVATVAYTRAGDRLVSLYRPASGDVRTFHADGLGSVRMLTDAAGSPTDTYAYTAFGELLSHTGTDPQPYLFAGEPFEPSSGLSYNRARWLDVADGRFLSVDPHDPDLRSPIDRNVYLYARSNPVLFSDPTGEFAMLVGAAVRVGVRTRLTQFQMAVALALSTAIVCTLIAVADGGGAGGQGVCRRNTMRVQLQTGHDDVASRTAIAVSPIGVTSAQVRRKMHELEIAVTLGERKAPFPNSMLKPFRKAIIKTSLWLYGAVAAGGVLQTGRPTVFREEWVDPASGRDYRLDLENVLGHNLKI